MNDDRQTVHDLAIVDRDGGRRGRRTARTRPPKAGAVGRLGSSALVPAAAGQHPVPDRVQRETTLIGALQLVEEGLAAAEESYRRVLAVFEASVGEHHSEAADVHRRLAEAERARGHTAESDYHAGRAVEIDRILGALPIRQEAQLALVGRS
jgi:hypothetical protein